MIGHIHDTVHKTFISTIPQQAVGFINYTVLFNDIVLTAHVAQLWRINGLMVQELERSKDETVVPF